LGYIFAVENSELCVENLQFSGAPTFSTHESPRHRWNSSDNSLKIKRVKGRV